MRDGVQQITRFAPAFDRRHVDPARNYGIHGVEMHLALKGASGAVSLVIFTNWQLSHVRAEAFDRFMKSPGIIQAKVLWEPMIGGLFVHSRQPQHEGHRPHDGHCEYIDGTCYSESAASSLADRMFEVLITQGDEGFWREMQEFYDEQFPAEAAQQKEFGHDKPL